MSAAEKERPCGCGGKGLGLNGFHYEGAHGCRKAHHRGNLTALVNMARAERLTPSKIALARVLKAWVAWECPTFNQDSSNESECMRDIWTTLETFGLVDGGSLSGAGEALLDKARKAGVV